MNILTENVTRRWLVASALGLAVALVGCADGSPIEEVRVGGGASPVSTTVAASSDGSAGPSATGPSTTGPASSGGSAGGIGPGGIGAGEPGQTDPSPPAPGPTTPPGESVPQPPTTIPDRHAPLGHPHRWDDYAVAGDGRTLTFSYYAGVEPCSVFGSIVADEGPDTVRVTVYERSGPEGVACIMLAQQKSASVTLEVPLGGRAVVDGAVT